MEQRQEAGGRNLAAVSRERALRRSRWEKDNMQLYAIVGRVIRVPVRRPIPRIKVQLNIALDRPARFANPQPRMPKVRPAKVVPLTAPLNSDRPPVERFEPRLVKSPLVPDFLKQSLRKRERPVSPQRLSHTTWLRFMRKP